MSISLSRAERFALGGALVLLVGHAVVALFAPAGAALEYQRAALAREPWRFMTAHLVHINTMHAVVNAAAWVIVARLFARELAPGRQMAIVVVASLAIDAWLAWRHAEIAWYRGFSGVLHALFFAGATAWLLDAVLKRACKGRRAAAETWLPAALVAGGWVKVIWEQPGAGVGPVAAWLGAATVPQAHLAGALCGTFFGVLFALRGRSAAPARNEAEQAEQQ